MSDQPIESLERRSLLSISVVSKTNALEIIGTDADDAISVSPHASLINVVRVVVKNATSREEKLISVGRFHTIKVWGEGGDDSIKIDPALKGLIGEVTVSLSGGDGDDTIVGDPLAGTIQLGDGDDHASFTTTEYLQIFGGNGKDRIEVGGGHQLVDGGSGDDTIVASTGNHTLRGGGGDDNIRASSIEGFISGGTGNDRIAMYYKSAELPAGYDGSKTPSAGVTGDAGNDTLIGSSFRDHLLGGDGDDRLIADKTSSGGFDELDGGAGNDVLDASGTTSSTLHGGDGNDDLYSGSNTYGYGEAGRDWFEDDDGWAFTDRGREDVVKGGAPNTPSYSSDAALTLVGSTASSGIDMLQLALMKVDDVGYIVTTAYGAQMQGHAARLLKRDANGQLQTPVSLTAKERNAVHSGVVRLSAGWTLTPSRTSNSGSMVWYDVNANAQQLSSQEFGYVKQLCVRKGTVVVTSNGSTNMVGRIDRVNATASSLWLPIGATAHVAGDDAAYAIAGDVPESAATAISKRHGILVDGGVLWLASEDGPTAFVAI